MHEAFWNGLFDVCWEEAPLRTGGHSAGPEAARARYAERTCRDYGHAVVHLGRYCTKSWKATVARRPLNHRKLC